MAFFVNQKIAQVDEPSIPTKKSLDMNVPDFCG